MSARRWLLTMACGILWMGTPSSCYSSKVKVLCAILTADALELLIEISCPDSLVLLHHLVLIIPEALHHILLIGQHIIKTRILPRDLQAKSFNL